MNKAIVGANAFAHEAGVPAWCPEKPINIRDYVTSVSWNKVK